MLDMSEIFNDPMLSQQVPILRRKVMKDIHGDQTNEYVLPVNITAVVHPTGADDIQLLPEGERYLPSKRIFSKESIGKGDVLIYQDKRWRIAAISDWSEYGFYDAIGVLHEGTQSPTTKAFKLD